MTHDASSAETPEQIAKPEPITVSEVESLARQKLSKQVWDFYVSGADAQRTAKMNQTIYDRLILRPRVLRDVSSVDTSTSVFGMKYSFPLAIAPSAMQRLVGGEGEIDMCRAAHKVGINYILSSNSTTLLENVIQAPCRNGVEVDPQFWFQIYVFQAREKTKSLIERVEKAGFKALVVTVDSPVLGNRINERKTALVLPANMSVVNMADPMNASTKESGPSKNRLLMNARTAAEAREIGKTFFGSLNDASLTWEEFIPWLRRNTSLKIVLKGIMTAEDALIAVQKGVDGIVVSNHGGRQLDGVSSTLEALPDIVDAVQGKIPIIFDGGIRTGSDIFKALALGADLCLVGRTALWGLGYNGQEGVELVLNILERELTRTMCLVGARSIKDISRSMLGVSRQEKFGIAKL